MKIFSLLKFLSEILLVKIIWLPAQKASNFNIKIIRPEKVEDIFSDNYSFIYFIT